MEGISKEGLLHKNWLHEVSYDFNKSAAKKSAKDIHFFKEK